MILGPVQEKVHYPVVVVDSLVPTQQYVVHKVFVLQNNKRYGRDTEHELLPLYPEQLRRYIHFRSGIQKQTFFDSF